MRSIPLLALLLAACAPVGAQRGGPSSPVAPATSPAVQPAMAAVEPALPPQVSTAAFAEARTTPDRALIELGVTTRARTAEQAARENAQRVEAVLAALRRLGLSSEQLTTVNYSVYPEQRFDPQRGDREPTIVGYNVTNTVRAEIRQLDRVGPAIDAALAAGANVVQSLNFFASDVSGARQEALREAVRKARNEAETLAIAAGGRLGRLLELTTVDAPVGGPRPLFRARGGDVAEAAVATPIEPGQQTVRVSVTGVWEFVPGR